jgi:hypothetical protein
MASLKQLSYRAAPFKTIQHRKLLEELGDAKSAGIMDQVRAEKQANIASLQKPFNLIKNKLVKDSYLLKTLALVEYVISQDINYAKYSYSLGKSRSEIETYLCTYLKRCENSSNWDVFLALYHPGIKRVFDRLLGEDMVLPKYFWALYYTHKIGYDLYWTGQDQMTTIIQGPGKWDYKMFLPTFLMNRSGYESLVGYDRETYRTRTRKTWYRKGIYNILYSDKIFLLKLRDIYNYLMNNITRQEMENEGY